MAYSRLAMLRPRISTSHSFPVGVVLLIVAAVLAVVAVLTGRRRRMAKENVGV